jgi:acetyl esterase/lipase
MMQVDADSFTHRLWTDRAPLAVGEESGDVPELTVMRARGTGPRPAIIVLPGGGYGGLADHEKNPVGAWLNTLGITALVLKYRHAPRYRHPAPMLDAQRAIRTARARADQWSIDPGRVGVLGFSAGGHLCATVSNLFDDGSPAAPDPIDRFSSRPDLSLPIYPVISFDAPFSHTGSFKNLLGPTYDGPLQRDLSMETRVSRRTPPTFIFHTFDDLTVSVDHALVYAMALRAAGVPFELHVFQPGGHGVGLALQHPVLKAWTPLCATWLAGHGFAAG